MMQPFRLVDELGSYEVAKMSWSQADKENARLCEKGNGRRWVPDLDAYDYGAHFTMQERREDE